MDQAKSICELRVNKHLPHQQTRIFIKLHFRAEHHLFARCWMFETDFSSMQIDPPSRRPAIKGIAKDAQTFLRGVDSDLMGAAREGFSDQGGGGKIQDP